MEKTNINIFKCICACIFLVCAIFLSFGNSAFAKDISLIEIAPGNAEVFTRSRIFSNCLSANTDVATVEKISSTKFRVKGVSSGTTYIYLWKDIDSLATIKVAVKASSAPPDAESEKVNLQRKKPLKIEYQNATYGGGSASQYTANQWAYSGSFNRIAILGDTPFGETSSYMQFSGYNRQYGLTDIMLNIKSDKYYFIAGDADTALSPIMMPYLHYQGLLYKNWSMIKDVEFTLLGGARGKGYWGRDALRDSRPVMPFAAAQVSIKKFENLTVDITAVTASTEGSAAKANILGLSAKYRPFNFLSLGGDIANSSLGGRAYQAETSVNYRALYLKGMYRNIPSDFQVPSDLINIRGIEGVFLSGTFNPFSFLRMSGEGSRYKNLYLQAGSSNNYNKDIRVRADLVFGPATVLSYSPWRQDHAGFVRGGFGEGSDIRISHSLKILGKTDIYARYEPTRFTQTETNEADYTNNKTVAGVRLGLTDAFSVNLENEWDAKTNLSDSSVENTRFARIDLNWASKIAKTALYSTINAHYLNGTDASGPISEFWSEAEIGYQPSDDTKIYIRGKTADYKGTVTNTSDRSEKHISFGLKTIFDSNFIWAGSGDIKGYVFNDADRNGLKDEGEVGFSGIRVYTASQKATTNASGMYSFKGLRPGRADVSVDISSIGPDYIMTMPSPVAAEIVSGGTTAVNFGACVKSGIDVTVFNDLNRNNIFDKKDIPVYGVDLIIDDLRYTTDSNGNFQISDMKEGEYELLIDIETLPKNCVPTAPVKQILKITEGRIKKLEIPLRFSR